MIHQRSTASIRSGQQGFPETVSSATHLRFSREENEPRILRLPKLVFKQKGHERSPAWQAFGNSPHESFRKNLGANEIPKTETTKQTPAGRPVVSSKHGYPRSRG